MEEGRNKSQREMDNNRQATRSQAKQAPGKAGPGSACSASNKVLHGMPTFSLRTNIHTDTHEHADMHTHANSETRTQSRTLQGNNKIDEIFTTSASSKQCTMRNVAACVEAFT